MVENSFQTNYRYWKRNLKSGWSRWTWKRFKNKRWYQNLKVWERNRKRKHGKNDKHENDQIDRLKQEERIFLNRKLDATPGTAEWLISTEIKYGGMTTAEIKPEKMRPYDRRGRDDSVPFLASGGGDRMLHHGYAKHYQHFLQPYVQNRNQRIVIFEVGILKGSGLAIWCDLFPNARCIGLDLDLSIIENNMDNLLQLGAFSMNSPELFEYDQFVYSADYLKEILGEDKVDIVMDDGHHSDESILTTLKSVRPHLKENFVYMIEDNPYVHKKVRSKYKECTLYSYSELTVVTSLPPTTH